MLQAQSCSTSSPPCWPPAWSDQARDLVKLEFPALSSLRQKATTLRLRNELGQLLEERRLDELPEQMDWDINTLNPGMYFIEVHAEGQLPQMLRLVKAS